MNNSISLTGIVLKVMPVNEYDKRIVLLTKERGKITAFARGARRPKSSMQAATNIFCFGVFEAFPGKDSYTIVRAEIKHYFTEMTRDLDMTYYGCYFLEVAEYFTLENADAKNQLNLLYLTLKALALKTISNRLIRCIYEIKTLVFNGTCPDFYDTSVFGTIESPRHVSGATLYTLQYIMSSPLTKLYTFTVNQEVLKELEQISGKYMNRNVDRDFNSLAFLA